MEMITSVSGLEQASQEWLGSPVLALDTEFFWERTFYPILGVVQVAAGVDRCWLVDAVQVRDLSALGPVLAAQGVTKILHDAVQDLGILDDRGLVSNFSFFISGEKKREIYLAGVMALTVEQQAMIAERFKVSIVEVDTNLYRLDWQ